MYERQDPDTESIEFSRQMALALAPVFAKHFLQMTEKYTAVYIAQHQGITNEKLMEYQSNELAEQIHAMIRNHTLEAVRGLTEVFYPHDF